MRMRVDMMKYARLVRLVQGVIVYVGVKVGVVWYGYASRRRYLRREIGRTLPVLLEHKYVFWGSGKSKKQGYLLVSHQYWSS